MPLYEYHRADCTHDCELLIRGSEQPACPECGSIHLTKLLSVPSAPGGGSKDLPMLPVGPRGGGCGLPQCGSGGCGIPGM